MTPRGERERDLEWLKQVDDWRRRLSVFSQELASFDKTHSRVNRMCERLDRLLQFGPPRRSDLGRINNARLRIQRVRAVTKYGELRIVAVRVLDAQVIIRRLHRARIAGKDTDHRDEEKLRKLLHELERAIPLARAMIENVARLEQEKHNAREQARTHGQVGGKKGGHKGGRKSKKPLRTLILKAYDRELAAWGSEREARAKLVKTLAAAYDCTCRPPARGCATAFVGNERNTPLFSATRADARPLLAYVPG